MQKDYRDHAIAAYENQLAIAHRQIVDMAARANVQLEEMAARIKELEARPPGKPDIDILVGRFLNWTLPKSVCSDTCVSTKDYEFPRHGTSLLSGDQSRQMFEHVLAEPEGGK